MAYILNLNTFSDARGKLTVIEKVLPFEVKRVFYIHSVINPMSERGKHRHKRTQMAVVCVKGSCRIVNNAGLSETEYFLNNPETCLILEPQDWHYMFAFSFDAVLLVLASEYFDVNDYIYDKYLPE